MQEEGPRNAKGRAKAKPKAKGAAKANAAKAKASAKADATLKAKGKAVAQSPKKRPASAIEGGACLLVLVLNVGSNFLAGGDDEKKSGKKKPAATVKGGVCLFLLVLNVGSKFLTGDGEKEDGNEGKKRGSPFPMEFRTPSSIKRTTLGSSNRARSRFSQWLDCKVLPLRCHVDDCQYSDIKQVFYCTDLPGWWQDVQR